MENYTFSTSKVGVNDIIIIHKKIIFFQSINKQDTLMLLSQRTTITYEKCRLTIFLRQKLRLDLMTQNF